MTPTRALAASLAVYAPHLFEEHVGGMHDDPLIAAPYALVFGAMPAREASYLVFQGMLVALLLASTMVSLGGRARDAVIFAVALGLVAESHHLLRALASGAPNVGLLTSLPMPVLGVAVLASLVRARSSSLVTVA